VAQLISADIMARSLLAQTYVGRSYRSRSHAGFSPADIHGGSVSRVRVVPQTGGLILLAVAVLLGACTQRLTGIGFALVASPLLVLVLGPTDGVHVSNVLNLAVSLVVLSQTHRNIDLRRALTLAFPALAGIPLGLWVTKQVSVAVLYVIVGGLVVVALLLVTIARRVVFRPSVGLTIGAGAASGFMNVTAAVAGPAVTLYARATRWEHHSFVGTIQLYFVIVNGGTILVKGGLPAVSWEQFLACGAGLVVGAMFGRVLSRHVSVERAGQLMLGFAFAGGLAIMAKGFSLL